LIERAEELVGLRSGGVGNKDDILWTGNLRARKGFAVSEIEAVDDRRDICSAPVAIG
jgi:hypothetical protein